MGLVEAFAEFLAKEECPADAAAIGGSGASAGGDALSDIDLFVYCGDARLQACVGLVCDWARRELGDVSATYGPFLRDDFGIGYRFLRGWQVPLEIFFVPESSWVPAPSKGKARLIFERGKAGEVWRQRIEACREGFDQRAFLLSYFEQQLVVWFSKTVKYLARGECAAASQMCLRILPALIATREYLEYGRSFDPDFVIRKLEPAKHPELSRLVHEEQVIAVADPWRSFFRLAEQARHLEQRLSGGNRPDGGANFEALEAKAHQLRGTVPNRSLRDLNRTHWEEVSRIHPQSAYYQAHEVAAGKRSISAIELAELGELTGKRGVHLQCGIGLDTITLARAGASMLGIDFSANALENARRLAEECNSPADFLLGDILDAATLPDERFDFVYASHGVLRWLASLETWAQNVRTLVKPGGFMYLFEIHPLVYRLTGAEAERAELSGDYFDQAPKIKRRTQTHCGELREIGSTKLVHIDWTVADVLNALARNGFRIDFYNEHRGTSYMRKGLLPKKRDQLWYPASDRFPIPLAFSVKSTRS